MPARVLLRLASVACASKTSGNKKSLVRFPKSPYVSQAICRPKTTTVHKYSPCLFCPPDLSRRGFISTRGKRRQAWAWSAWAVPISPQQREEAVFSISWLVQFSDCSEVCLSLCPFVDVSWAMLCSTGGIGADDSTGFLHRRPIKAGAALLLIF